MSEIPVERPAGKGRPWLKWVAAGCFGLLVLGALAAGALVFGVLAVVKRSDVYEEAVSRARTEPRVTAALGEPVEPGWFVMGSVEVSGPGGEASLSIPLEGPRGEGTLYVEATKRAGAWVYETLQLAVEGSGERIDLLGEEPDEGAWPPAAPAPTPSSAAPEAGPRTAPRSPSLDAIVFSASEDAQPLATAATNWDGIEIDLMSVERKSSILTVKWGVRNVGDERTKADFSMLGEGASTYLVDEENGTKYYALTDQEGHLLASMHEYVGSNRHGVVDNIEPGTTKRYWAKFPAPPPEVETVSVFFTESEPLEGVAITDR